MGLTRISSVRDISENLAVMVSCWSGLRIRMRESWDE